MYDAFERLGHDVRAAGDRDEIKNRIWGMRVNARHIWNPKRLEEGWFPDLVLVMDSFTMIKNRLSCATAVYGVDNHVSRYFYDDGIRYDHYFFAHHDGPAMPVSEIGAIWLPCAYDERFFCSTDRSIEERPFDFGFNGVLYHNRAQLIDDIRDSGHSVLSTTGLLYGEYNAVMGLCKVGLCLSVNGDLAIRVFENMASGCVVMTDATKDLERLGARDGEEFIGFDGTIYDLIKKYDSMSESDLVRIQKNSERWVKNHTWTHRAQRILEVVFG
jgi:hypothetical protein